MSRNIIFVFSGTGNSLWAAKEIAQVIDDCEIVSMGKPYTMQGKYDSIGFVIPTYAGGVPRCVRDFISRLDLQNNKSSYFFAVATCGRIAKAQNVITQLRIYLKLKGITLSYGERLDMFSNYVNGYEMRDTVREETEQSAVDLKPMVENIKNRKTNNGNTTQTLRKFESMGFMLIVGSMDKGFNINATCNGCGTCTKICPVENIKMQTGKLEFLHHCEQCLACIQWCPKRAINYKDKTQNRGRYHHPEITLVEMTSL